MVKQQLYSLTSIRASERDIEDVRQRVAAGVAVTKALELVYFRRLCQRIRAPASRDVPRARAVLASAAAPCDAADAGQLPGRDGPFRISHAAVPANPLAPARRVMPGVTATPVTAVVVGEDHAQLAARIAQPTPPQVARAAVAAAPPTDRRAYHQARRQQHRADVQKQKQDTQSMERQKQMRTREKVKERTRNWRQRKQGGGGGGK